MIPNLQKQQANYGDKNDPGAFHFLFWRFGTIWDVTIDDLLPISPECKRPMYSYNDGYTEFWVSMLEKAYAK